jgi:hypothetical protein
MPNKMCVASKGVFGRTPPEGLLRRSWSRFGGAIICDSSKMALPPIFFTEKAPHTKKFGKAPPEEPEPELRRSPTKHVLNIYSDPIPPS